MMDSHSDFSFGFRHTDFSDRLLRIEIMPDFLGIKSDGDGCSSTSEWARDRKPWLEQIKKENAVDVLVQHDEQISNCNMPDTEDGIPCQNQDAEAVAMIEESPSAVDVLVQHDEQISNCNMPDTEDGIPCQNQDAEAVAMIEESPSGDEPVQGNDLSSSGDGSTVRRVVTINICTLLLAAKSPFFKKLFSNGMRDSNKGYVTLRIHASEEAALMDVLNFMYNNSLSAATAYALLDVLMAADKFEVVSCMKYCSELLRNLPMTCESALLYLDLPSILSMAESVQPLTEAAKQFLARWFKDINKFQDEVMNLPLNAIEAVLSSDELQVASEDAVYDIMLQWARTHYLRPAERREIIGTRLARLIRFPYMTCGKLKKVLTCNDFDPEIASRVMVEALFFKAEAPYRRRSNAAEEANALYRGFVERVYKYRPVKVVEFEMPDKQCVVYLDLKREECAHLVPAGRVNSEAFHFGGERYFLSAQCNMDPMSSCNYFGLFLGMQENGSGYYALVEYVFEARSEITGEYMIVYRGTSYFSGGTTAGHQKLFGTTFSAFMADDHYFINEILHLRAELTIRQSSYERD